MSPRRVTVASLLAGLLALLLLALASPASAAESPDLPALARSDPVQADVPLLDGALALADDAVDSFSRHIDVRAPAVVEADIGLECHPSETAPTQQSCHGYVCTRNDGEGDKPVMVDDLGVGVDPKGFGHPGPYGPYSGVFVDGDCGCDGLVGLRWTA